MAGEVKLKTPEFVAKKYLDRTAVSKAFYIYGVKNPKRSPTEAALEAAETWRARVSADDTFEKWQARRRAAGDEKWLFGIETKGAERWPKGCEIGAVWMMDFMSKFLPHLAKGLEEVYKIERKSIEDAIKRVETLIRHNAKFKYEPSKISIEEAKKVLERLKALRIG